MDKKINFWQFQVTTNAIILAFLSIILGALAYYIASDYISWGNSFGALCALVFYISGCLSAVHKHNSDIEKNIKDKEK